MSAATTDEPAPGIWRVATLTLTILLLSMTVPATELAPEVPDLVGSAEATHDCPVNVLPDVTSTSAKCEPCHDDCVPSTDPCSYLPDCDPDPGEHCRTVYKLLGDLGIYRTSDATDCIPNPTTDPCDYAGQLGECPPSTDPCDHADCNPDPGPYCRAVYEALGDLGLYGTSDTGDCIPAVQDLIDSIEQEIERRRANGGCQNDLRFRGGKTYCDVAAQELANLGNLLAEHGAEAAQTQKEEREEGTKADDDVQPLPAEHSHTLETDESDGKWTITLTPDTSNLPLIDGSALPVTEYGSVSVSFPDRGYISQPASYEAGNPWPRPDAWLDDPPPTEAEIEEANNRCAAAIAFYGANIAAFVAGPNPASATTMAGSAYAAGWECGTAEGMSNDAGRWAANGWYTNYWGQEAKSRWDGELLSAGDVGSVDSIVKVHDPEKEAHPAFGNQYPYEGYYEQRQKYQNWDMEDRSTAWNLHNTFMKQRGDADASIELDLPILRETLDLAGETLASLGETPLGEAYYILEDSKIIFDCNTGCSDSAVLTISSPGTGLIIPGERTVKLAFSGDSGAAKISLLGVVWEGFTLDGEHGGGDGGLPSV